MINYTSNVYSDTGLVPTNFILKSPVSGTVVDLPLCPSVPELQESPVVEEKIDEAPHSYGKLPGLCSHFSNTAQKPQGSYIASSLEIKELNLAH